MYRGKEGQSERRVSSSYRDGGDLQRLPVGAGKQEYGV